MERFFIMAAPLITIAAAVASLFFWGAKGSIKPRK